LLAKRQVGSKEEIDQSTSLDSRMYLRISSSSPGGFRAFIDYSDLMRKRALSAVNMGRRIAASLYNLTKLSEKVGSGAEAENVELMKSGEDGRFYRVKV
jgi:hypothetical protein